MILIPAYNPDEVLLKLISGIKSDDKLANIPLTLINDGSDCIRSKNFFRDIQEKFECVKVIAHNLNLGKGAAIKTGLKYAEEVGHDFVITVDADGQHAVNDIKNVYLFSVDHKDKLVIGTRDFKNENVPMRSKVGNLVTLKIFNFLNNCRVEDTQSGLRYIPRHSFSDLLELKGNRYEFEQDVLAYFSRCNSIAPPCYIETIYEEGNPSSHFNKFRDSLLIYYTLLRSAIVGLFCACVDFGLFSFLYYLLDSVTISVVSTRVMMVIVYFVFLKHIVFKAPNASYREFAKFSLLVAMNSLIIIMISSDSESNVNILYLATNLTMFVVNFIVQRHIFGRD
ncbi:glycosyltransferase [Vibrio sp. 10N.261.55.A7]|uniref:glycosyltransferase n=1 Tax=Vibrio sp. 10N.261.55.A7 TaxID=1880851 RepID=UPI000C85250E|nr:glycosyltransferase [Vibrio sp. 10N.261.55.A7]PMJ88897.1 hypothetical protein BCU12_14425 [Vibrio sp. 10N.261.55.A7]